jgi:predicted nucleic-acid-binding protein
VKAVDTNVLARFFVDDPEDPEARRQRPAAIRVMSGSVFVSMTVVLEFEWVLRGFYEINTRDIGKIFVALCSLDNVSIENREALLQAIGWHAAGMDFADALHTQIGSARCESFVTFDKKLAAKAKRLKTGRTIEWLR